MISSFRTLLLTSVCSAFLLAACDQSDTTDSTGTVGSPDLSSYGMMFDQQPSWAGSYLSSRVAQNRFDWGRAEGFLTKTMEQKSDQSVLARRSMLLALGAGDIPQAEKWATLFDKHPDPSGLTHFIRLIGALKTNNPSTVRTVLSNIPENALSKFALPLITAWVNAEDQKTSTKTVSPTAMATPSLSGNGVYEFHRILIADYLGNIPDDIVKNAVAATRESITPMSAEQLGDIFLRYKKFDTASEFYQLAKSASPELTGIDARIKAAENKDVSLPAPLILTPRIASMANGVALALFDMASTFYNDQSHESAVVFARISLALNPNLIEAKLLIANILAGQNRLSDAIDLYQEIPKTDPRYVAVQQRLASLRVDQGQDHDAIKTLNALINETTNIDQKIGYLIQIGDIERENEDFKSALSAYDTAINLVGEPPKSEFWALYYARGMTLERLKKWDRAEADLKTALAFQPDHPYIMNYLGYSWADQGIHLDDAMKLLLRAVSIVPDDGYVTDSVGWAYYKQGKYTEAVEYLERAVELLPYDGTVNDHLGDAYAKVGRTREAQFQWQRALNYGEDEAAKDVIRKKLN